MNSMTVLVIDDDPVYRELLSLALASEGYRVVLAENGNDGVSALERDRDSVDFVIVDMLMPKMDGLRFLSWLREESKSNIPALVLTSNDSRNVSVEALVAGATDVLVKPVSLPILTQKIRSIVSQR